MSADHVLVFAKDTVDGERIRLCVRCGIISIEPNQDFLRRYYFVPGKSYSPSNPHRLIPIYEMPRCKIPRGNLMPFTPEQQRDNLNQPLEECRFTHNASLPLLKILRHNGIRLASDLQGKTAAELFDMKDEDGKYPSKIDLRALIEALKPASVFLDPHNRLDTLERIKDAEELPAILAHEPAGPFVCPDCKYFFYVDPDWLDVNGTICRCCYCGKKVNVPYRKEAP